MSTYYFLEGETLRRIAEYRRTAEQDRLAVLAQLRSRREAQTFRLPWLTALLQVSALSHLLGRRSTGAGPEAILQ